MKSDVDFTGKSTGKVTAGFGVFLIFYESDGKICSKRCNRKWSEKSLVGRKSKGKRKALQFARLLYHVRDSNP